MIILASRSPRRRELLSKVTCLFKVVASDAEEITDKIRPSAMVRQLASLKARAVAALYPEDTVIGADTVVYYGKRVYGKPRDKKEAEEFLRTLCGREHRVYTGVCVMRGGRVETVCEVSYVTLRKMSDEEIRSYVEGGSPMDKAGAYGIQDGIVEKYRGDYDNIVGLPVSRLRIIGLFTEAL